MNPDRKKPTVVLVVAIFAAAALEGMAMWRGMDGKFFALTMGLIGAVAGVTISRLLGPPSLPEKGED